MNGPEHYAEAERLVEGIKQNPAPGNAIDAMVDRNTVLAAQVHATLALAAATAASQATAYDGDELGARSRGWACVA